MRIRIKALRQKLNLTQTEFAEKIGIPMRTFQDWEYGKNQIKESALRLIETAFNVNPEWLRTGEGVMFGEAGVNNDSLNSMIIGALNNGLVSDDDKEFIVKYIEERIELAQLRTEKNKKKKAI